MQTSSKASKAILKLQTAFRGAAERHKWMDPMMQVSVTLISARGLKAADSNGKSDPYAKLHLHKHSHQSQTKYKTLDPEWGEEFFWKGKKGPMLSKPLHIQLFDHDMLSFDDPLGWALHPPAPTD